MAIQLVSVQCPNCNANLEIESDRETAFCTYCGAKIIVSNENEHVYRHIDEARIREIELEKMKWLKEMEDKEKEKAQKRRARMIEGGMAIASVIIGAIVEIWDPLGLVCGFTFAMFFVLLLIMGGLDSNNSNNFNNEKRLTERYVDPNMVQITDAMDYYEDKNYNSVVMTYRAAGFKNVTAIPLKDITSFSIFTTEGAVESVSINGNDMFREGDIFPKDAIVLVNYHSNR